MLLLCLLWWAKADAPVNSGSDKRVTVRVEPGMSASAVANLLEDEGLIRSSLKFRWIAARSGLAGKLQAGTYALQPSQTPQEILEELAGGKQQEVVVTIPEGFTVADIDALIARLGLAKEGDVQECARSCAFEGMDFLPPKAGLADRGGRVEGYLYADTYFVDPQSFTPEAFLMRLLKTFRQRVVDAHADDFRASKRSMQEIITMASLIEEETRGDDERPIVSGILWKRLDANMGLQVDATVRYILNKPSATITAADLQIDSPYNTRKFRGLPPGPIACPSLASIEAALRPQQSGYWYYLHDAAGHIHYAETNDQHNANRAKYL